MILALVLVGLLSAFSVALLRLASTGQLTVSSARESAYRNAARDAAALMARQLVADGLGCPDSSGTPAQVTADFSAETIQLTVAQSPPGCPPPDRRAPDVTLGDYVLCGVVTIKATSVTYSPTVTVSAVGGGSQASIEIVHFSRVKQGPCP